MRSDSSRRAPSAFLAAGCAAALLLTGCARTTLESSVIDRPEAAQDPMTFLADLEASPVVTNNDALHALFLLVHGEDPHDTWEERVETARDLGWLPLDEEAPPADESVAVGRLATAMTRAADIEGGLTMRLFGPGPRQSTREMVALGVLPDRSPQQALSGREFLETMGRFEDLLERRVVVAPEDRLREIERRMERRAREQEIREAGQR